MKHLYLIRHAKSSWDEAGVQDHERSLGKRGHEQLGFMAAVIGETGAMDGVVYCSDARRTRQTLEGLIQGKQRPTVHIEDCLYTFDEKVLLDWLRGRSNEDRIALIGHNPALEKLAGCLLGEAPGRFPTCGCMHITLNIAHWCELGKNKGRLKQFLRPRDISYEAFSRTHKKIKQPTITGTLQQLYTRMRCLETGVIHGFDNEFLHQYRITIRRSRAIAESLSEFTDLADLRTALKALKTHAAATSYLRDIHVMLGDLDGWLPQEACSENTLKHTLHSHFTKLAKVEQQKLIRHITGVKHRKRMSQWQQLIQSPEFESVIAKLTDTDIRQVLSERLKRFNRKSRKLTENSPDEKIHDVRKLLKRIRYLAELETACPRKLLKQLKHRQKKFGKFQDLYVQINLLQSFQEGSAAKPWIAKQRTALKEFMQKLAAEKKSALNAILALDGINKK